MTFAFASTSISTISRFPLAEARASGVSWYPPVSGSGIYYRIEIEIFMQSLHFFCLPFSSLIHETILSEYSVPNLHKLQNQYLRMHSVNHDQHSHLFNGTYITPVKLTLVIFTAAWQAINMPSNSVQPLATAAKTQLSPFYFNEKEKMKYMLRTSLYVMVKCRPASNQTLACMTWHESILTTDIKIWILLEPLHLPNSGYGNPRCSYVYLVDLSQDIIHRSDAFLKIS